MLALEARYRGLVSGHAQRIILWLPLHRTPAYNVLMRANRWKQHELRAEAQKAVLTARVSTLPYSASVPSMPNQNLPR